MTEPESWQVSSDAAEIYEKVFVPTLVGQWAVQVADAARITAGDRVLDVGCGTGVLAREAITRVGSSGRVTGLDLNEGMLAVAQRIEPHVEWRRGDAVDLPFDDGSFDVVVSQFVLMYLPDRIAAIKEMKRVLAPEGRLAAAVWGPFERATGYVILTELVKRHGGEAAANLLTAPHALGDQDKLTTLFKASGFDNLEISLREGVYAQPSIEHFIEYEVKGTPLDDFFNEESYQDLLKAAHEGLSSFVTDSGKVVVPMDAIIVTAQKEG
jgi:ubiquinone/menaquinone biosynthesis C-methylase UbiE